MRRSIVVAALIASLFAAVACAEEATKVAPTPTPFGERVPALAGELPEGTLVVQDENPIGYPRFFAVSATESKHIAKGPSVSVSPDGRSLAAIEWDADHHRWRIRLMGADGEQRAVLQAPESGPFANVSPPFPMWSPNGERLAYTRRTARRPTRATFTW